jgi:hypothetical protein
MQSSRAHSARRTQYSVSRPQARSVFQALFQQAAVGSVSEGRVVLQRVIPFVHNSFKPFFVGSFERTATGVVLKGKFSIHWLVRIFMTFWLGSCLLCSVLALWAGVQHPSEARFVPLGGIAMFAFGLALVRGGGGGLQETILSGSRRSS